MVRRAVGNSPSFFSYLNEDRGKGEYENKSSYQIYDYYSC